MDSDRIEGPLKEGAGKVKEAWGDATDDPQTEAEGQKDRRYHRWGEAGGKVFTRLDVCVQAEGWHAGKPACGIPTVTGSALREVTGLTVKKNL
jgi:hypothetical protein